MKNRLKKLVPDFSHSDGTRAESVSLVSSSGYASSQLRGGGLYSLLETALNKAGTQNSWSGGNLWGSYTKPAAPSPAPTGNPSPRLNYDSIVFENGDLNFHEMYLQDGSQYSPWQDNALLTRTVQKPTYMDGNGVTRTCTVDTSSTGWKNSGGNTWTMNHEFGYWTYDKAANKLTYTFDSKAGHLKNSLEDDALSRDYDGAITFVGENGVKYEDVKFEITVHDDTPEALSSSVQIQTSESVNSFLEINGGADGVAKLVISVNGKDYDVTGATAQNKVDIAGEFGQMQVWKDGSGYWRYSYTAKSGSEVSQNVVEKFTFTVTDGDGDVVTIKDALEIQIERVDVPSLDLEVGSVDEAGLPVIGSDPSGASRQTGWVALDPDLLPMGAQISGKIYSSLYGEVEVRLNELEQYEFRYTLTNPMNHPDGQGRNVDKDSVTITYTDPVTGAQGEINVKVNVTDDLPSIDFGSGQGRVQSGQEFTGSYNLAYGADRAADNNAIKLTVVDPATGQGATITANAGSAILVKIGSVEYGTLYLNEGSTFRFKANDGVSGKLEFHLSVTDKDGDTASSDAPFVIEIVEPITKIEQVDKNFYFDEAHLPEGNAEFKKPGQLFGELEIPKTSGGDYYSIDTSTGGWALMNSDPSYQHWELNVQGGKLIYMYDVKGYVPPMLMYQLNQATMHARPGVNPGGPGDDEMTFNVGKVTLGDSSGNKFIVDVEVQVRDDNPYAVVSKGGDDYLSGNGSDHNFVSSGEFTPHFGADGAHYDAQGGIRVAVGSGGPVLGGGAMGHWTWLNLPANGAAQKVYTTHGWLSLSWDPATQKVTYTYTGVRGNAGEVLDFRFYVYDADGDTGKAAEFKITLGADVPDVVLNVSESGLAIGSSPNAADTTDSGSMSADHLRLTGTSITWNTGSAPNVKADCNGDGIYSKVTWIQSGNQLIGSAEGKVVASIVPVFKNGVFTGEMSVNLFNPIQHDKGANDQFMDLGFKYAVNGSYVDENGVSKPASQGGNLVVRVEDDEPVFGGSGGNMNPDSGNLLTNVHGADAISGVVSVWVNGVEYAVTRQSNGSMSTKVININGAKMVVYGDGTYTVDKQGVNGSVDATIRVTVSDADGDLATGPNLKLTIAQTNKAPTAVDDYSSVNEDALGASGNVLYNDTDPDGNALSVLNAGTYATNYGFITINADGSYKYSVNTSNSAVKALYDGTHSDPNYKLSDSFTYKISDGHGGSSSAQIKFDLTPNQLKLPSGGQIVGGQGDDVIVGDLGGVQAAVGNVKAYNVAFIVDTSGSIENMNYVKCVLNSLAKQLESVGENAQTHINVSLISFWNNSKLEFTLNGLDSAADLNSLYNAINKLQYMPNGYTNFESGFMQAAGWFKKQPSTVGSEFGGQGAGTTYKNVVYFLSDGVVNKYTPDSYKPSGNYPAISVADWIPGTLKTQVSGNYATAIRDDGAIMISTTGGKTWSVTGTSVYNLSQGDSNTSYYAIEQAKAAYQKYFDSQGVKVNAIGATKDGAVLVSRLENFDNTNGIKLVGSYGQQLDADIKGELAGIVPGTGSSGGGLTQAQGSVLKGTAGFNTMFGDALNADWLLSDKSWNQTGLKAGQSYDIVRAYVMQKNGLGANAATLNDEIREFIEANSFKFGASEAGRGGNDTLYGGNNGNIMFGQGGNDTLVGGNGSDLLVGGSGTNLLIGGTGADVFLFKAGESTGVDKIYDFKSGEGDIVVKVGSGNFGSITGSYTTGDVHDVVDVRQGHSITITDSQNHMLVGSGYSDSKIVSGGGKYDNVLNGGGGNDVIFGGRGDNLLNGGAGNDYIIGGTGNDRIYGGSGNDILYGGAGNDIMYGGTGNNTLYGGAGQDVFTWQSRSELQGKDILMDFSTSEDHLSFNPLLNAGQTLANFFSSNVKNMSFNNAAHTFSFSVTNGSSSKPVEVHFGNNDAGYNAAYADFLDAGSDQAAQQAAMLNFLNSISGGI